MPLLRQKALASGIALFRNSPLSTSESNQPHIVDLASLPGVPCPCGTARRAFADVAEFPGTIHLTEISTDAETHYHKTLTETYYILECKDDAQMELDGQLTPLKPGMCIMIPPGVRHRAIGEMKILNIVFPKFDPADEFVD
ncbi:MAG TPA: cupin [Planctomycetaceae bacterium]|nr:cupin [Planctomycetaceae bacterium]